MCDFGGIYFGSRYAFQHHDPYNPNAVASVLLKELALEDAKLPANPVRSATVRTYLTIQIYPPSTLFILAPFGLLHWKIAQNLWMILSAILLASGAWLIGELGAAEAPDVWLLLTGFLLANCEGLLLDGNVAGLAVSLCVIATWSFLKERYVLLGAVLFAVSLLVKPHDSGFVWLYFLLAGGRLRKRALQTLAIAAVLAFCSLIWIAPIAPHWPHEVQRNFTTYFARGDTDPSLSGTSNNGAGKIIDLQGPFSILWNNPLFYNLTSYLVAGILILIWAITTLTRRASPQKTLFALAAISALSLLPVYHRPYDAKLLLLAVPACAMLWAGKGATRFIALGLTSASIFFTSDLPLAVLDELTRNLYISTSTLTGKLATVFLLRPAPLFLLATGCFYLWIYLRYVPPINVAAQDVAPANTLTADAAT